MYCKAKSRDVQPSRFDARATTAANPVSGRNSLCPDLMSTEERLNEIAEILVAGILRLRQKKKCSNQKDLRDYPVDFSPGRSVHATTRKRRRVAR
jgi:hypothetical protein